ncbi:hypothetical protein A9Q84_07030 [Halobacteriovorax marinus]|uniref:Poly A polymerase head domain-containing protein n=1 Tax=Halobacteriovorax marinus TaxID=97084 RepID=A0A1Y5FFF6_9BACT|nr:hypothetical protein A9Q84_07030 [Halobacteriovorax marinus]
MSDSKSLKNFSEHYPKEVRELLSLILSKGFSLTLVGGAVRDFLLDGVVSKDLDFEIRLSTHLSGDAWLEKLATLGKSLTKDHSYKVEVLSFNILRIKIADYEVELSSPRQETFLDREALGHSDFSGTFSSDLNYTEAYKRRDFTVNAIGIEFLVGDEFKLVDPYSGVKDLSSKTLNYIDESFFKDPVRFLRALRFKVKLGFTLSRELKDNIVYFNLEKLSKFYFLQEGRKIGLERMVYEMNFSVRKFAVKLPAWASEFSNIDTSLLSCINSLEELLIAHAKNSKTSVESIEKLAKDLGIKKSVPSALISLRKLAQLDFKKVCDEISGLEFDKACAVEEINSLVLARALKSKNSRELVGEFLSASFVEFIFCELEGLEKFESLKSGIVPKQRSMLGIYCHINKN